MKLELHHLACYLPYALGFMHQDEIYQLMQLNIKYDQKPMWIEGWNGKDLINVFPEGCQPILRPLSDLNKEIEINGQKFIAINWLENQYPNLELHYQCESLLDNERWINQCEYLLIQHLFEWHFDIFNLIENNLAIDINTINQ